MRDTKPNLNSCSTDMKRLLIDTHPEIAEEWDHAKNGELTPFGVTFGSGRKVWWLCDRGHSYQAQVTNRTKKAGGTGCPVCKGTQVAADNNLLLQFPSVAAQWHETKNGIKRPEDYRPKSHTKVYMTHWREWASPQNPEI